MSAGAADWNVNVRGVDHGPGLSRTSRARTRHAYSPAGTGVVGAHDVSLVVALNTRFALEKSVSPFFATSISYFAAKARGSHFMYGTPEATAPLAGSCSDTAGEAL